VKDVKNRARKNHYLKKKNWLDLREKKAHSLPSDFLQHGLTSLAGQAQ